MAIRALRNLSEPSMARLIIHHIFLDPRELVSRVN